MERDRCGRWCTPPIEVYDHVSQNASVVGRDINSTSLESLQMEDHSLSS